MNGEDAFGAGDPTFASCDVTRVAEGVRDSAPTIAGRMIVAGRVDRGSAGLEGAGEGGVGVGHIQVSGHRTLGYCSLASPSSITELPIETSACMIVPSGLGTRMRSVPSKAATRTSMNRGAPSIRKYAC